MWDESPPAHLQLARIAAMLGAATGAKAPTAGRGGAARPPPTSDELAALDALPTAPVTKYLTPDEYLARRNPPHD